VNLKADPETLTDALKRPPPFLWQMRQWQYPPGRGLLSIRSILISYPTWALVRDIVRAEERDSITAKGIRREVRVFAVAGIRDDQDPAPVARA
jgi:hypothetical protein